MAEWNLKRIMEGFRAIRGKRILEAFGVLAFALVLYAGGNQPQNHLIDVDETARSLKAGINGEIKWGERPRGASYIWKTVRY